MSTNIWSPVDDRPRLLAAARQSLLRRSVSTFNNDHNGNDTNKSKYHRQGAKAAGLPLPVSQTIATSPPKRMRIGPSCTREVGCVCVSTVRAHKTPHAKLPQHRYSSSRPHAPKRCSRRVQSSTAAAKRHHRLAQDAARRLGPEDALDLLTDSTPAQVHAHRLQPCHARRWGW